MTTRIRLLACAIAAVIITTSCTPEEVALYLESTAETRDELSNEELARLRHCESRDNYDVVSANGRFRGAYQFHRTTWDAVAERHFPWLIGIDPAAADPWWQDAMARALWSERGKQPWPVCGNHV